jgi:hypothetical protein
MTGSLNMNSQSATNLESIYFQSTLSNGDTLEPFLGAVDDPEVAGTADTGWGVAMDEADGNSERMVFRFYDNTQERTAYIRLGGSSARLSQNANGTGGYGKNSANFNAFGYSTGAAGGLAEIDVYSDASERVMIQVYNQATNAQEIRFVETVTAADVPFDNRLNYTYNGGTEGTPLNGAMNYDDSVLITAGNKYYLWSSDSLSAANNPSIWQSGGTIGVENESGAWRPLGIADGKWAVAGTSFLASPGTYMIPSESNAFTITELSCITDTGTVIIDLQEGTTTSFTGGTDVSTSPITCDSDSQVARTISNGTIAANAYMAVRIGTDASTPVQLGISWTATYD